MLFEITHKKRNTTKFQVCVSGCGWGEQNQAPMPYGIAKVRMGLQVRQQWFLETISMRRGLRDGRKAEKKEVN